MALLLAYEEVADLAAFLALENRIVQTYLFYSSYAVLVTA